jgi:uncharacterized protein YjiS (DUF1127 family)
MNTTVVKYGIECGHSRSPSSLVQALALSRTWYQRARQRRQLASLDRGQLEDVGISQGDALMEAAKPFWKA